MKSNEFVSLSLIVLCCVIGCSSGTPTEVKGKVLLDGQPVSHAKVQLLSKAGAAQSMHTAMTDDSGNFTILEAGNSNTPIQPGTYIVLVSKVSGGMGAAINEVPEIYNDRNKTPLTAEIQSSQTELPPFGLVSTSAKGKG